MITSILWGAIQIIGLMCILCLLLVSIYAQLTSFEAAIIANQIEREKRKQHLRELRKANEQDEDDHWSDYP